MAKNQWFEEMLCETASLYMLKRYASMWDVLTPRAEWHGYAPEIQRFTRLAITEEHRHLPRNVRFEDWFRENGPGLVSKPYLREKNELVAMTFLPLLEQTSDWGAIEYLNVENREGDNTFYDYLVRWYRKTPPEQMQLVESAFRVFQFKLPAESVAPAVDMKTTVVPDIAGRDEGAAGRPGP
jgi:hypothetical protein